MRLIDTEALLEDSKQALKSQTSEVAALLDKLQAKEEEAWRLWKEASFPFLLQ